MYRYTAQVARAEGRLFGLASRYNMVPPDGMEKAGKGKGQVD